MIVNGTADPINPYRGGMVNLGGAKLVTRFIQIEG